MSPPLARFLRGYVRAHEQDRTPDTSIYIYLLDSSRVDIHSLDIPADTTVAGVLGVEHMGKYDFYFMGVPNDYLYKRQQKPPLPQVRVTSGGIPPPPAPGYNYELWQLIFRQDSVISYSPQARINQYAY